MCDNRQARSGNEFYVKQSDNTLLSTTIDNTDYSQTTGKYRSETDSYGNFWTNSGNQVKQDLSKAGELGLYDAYSVIKRLNKTK